MCSKGGEVMENVTRKELEVLALSLKKLLEHNLIEDAIEVLDVAINDVAINKDVTDKDE